MYDFTNVELTGSVETRKPYYQGGIGLSVAEALFNTALSVDASCARGAFTYIDCGRAVAVLQTRECRIHWIPFLDPR